MYDSTSVGLWLEADVWSFISMHLHTYISRSELASCSLRSASQKQKTTKWLCAITLLFSQPSQIHRIAIFIFPCDAIFIFLCHAIFNFLCHFSIVSRVLVQIFSSVFAWLAFPHFTVHKLLVDFTRHFRLSIPFHNPTPELKALVYNILPSTTAVFSYAIGSRKLSANEQFFVGAQTVVSSLQTSPVIYNH